MWEFSIEKANIVVIGQLHAETRRERHPVPKRTTLHSLAHQIKEDYTGRLSFSVHDDSQRFRILY